MDTEAGGQVADAALVLLLAEAEGGQLIVRPANRQEAECLHVLGQTIADGKRRKEQPLPGHALHDVDHLAGVLIKDRNRDVIFEQGIDQARIHLPRTGAEQHILRAQELQVVVDRLLSVGLRLTVVGLSSGAGWRIGRGGRDFFRFVAGRRPVVGGFSGGLQPGELKQRLSPRRGGRSCLGGPGWSVRFERTPRVRP